MLLPPKLLLYRFGCRNEQLLVCVKVAGYSRVIENAAHRRVVYKSSRVQSQC
jgi:hypothetical protein